MDLTTPALTICLNVSALFERVSPVVLSSWVNYVDPSSNVRSSIVFATWRLI